MKSIFFIDPARFRRLSREGFWIVFGQVMVVLGSLVGVRLLTELLEPSTYGELALGMTLAMLITQTVLGPLSGGISRFYAPAVEKNDVRGYLKAVRRLVILATAFILLIILCVLIGMFIAGRTEWIGITIAALIFANLSGYTYILSGIQNAARQRSIVALHQGIEAWTRFLVAAGILMWFGATSTKAMIGYVIAVILVLGSQYVFFQRNIPKSVTTASKSTQWQRDIWRYSWPISFFGIFTWAQIASGRWALEVFTTTQEVGFYTVLFQLGYYPLLMTTGAATQFLGPILFQRAGDATDSQRNTSVSILSWRLTGMVLGATAVVFLVALQFHTEIFQIFVAMEYSSVSYLLPWMLLAGGILAAGQSITLNLMTLMKTRSMLAAKIVTALIGIILNFAGAYWYGVTGVVLASVLYSTSFFCWMIVLLRKEGIQKCIS